MSFFALSGLINGIFASGFGIFIIIKSWRNRINQLFFLMTLAVSLWSFSYWQWLSSDNSASALLWVRVLSIGSLFIPLFYFHWIQFLLGLNNGKAYRTITAFLYIVILPFLAFSLSPLFIKTVSSKLAFPFWPEPGILYTLYLVFIYFGLVAYSVYLLLRHYRAAKEEDSRRQIFYIILGSIFGFGGGLTNFFLWYNIPIQPYGNFLVALFPFFLGYAILKHHLLNIKAVAAELLTFAIWAAVLIQVFMANTDIERLFQIGLFVFVVILGMLLIRNFLKLEAANEKLVQLDKLKSEFLSFASHQLKAPMTVMKGYASMIFDGSFGEVPKGVKDTAGNIMTMTDRTIRMVNDFLNLRKLEEGKMDYRFGDVDILGMITNIVNELQIIAHSKKLKLTFEHALPATVPVMVQADEQKLREVIQNIVENSIKYTAEGFVKVRLNATKETVTVAVNDSGMGIPEDVLPHLFEQFNRGSAAGGKIQGTGLGLYIAKGIISAHKGRIWATSGGGGQGATFYVELPRVSK